MRTSFDTVISNGLIVDGSGSRPYPGDVGITGDRIAAIGEPGSLPAAATVDATGHIVTPGFIDLHTHYDAQVLWDPRLRPSSHLGVTSVVAGNCGFSIAPCPPELRMAMMRTLEGVEDMRVETLTAGVDWSFETFPEYLDAVEQRGPTINYGAYVGHTGVRMWVMGDDAFEREATPEEIDAMCTLVTEAISAGALGFSSDRSPFHRGDGGRRVPSAVATQEELERIWKAVDDLGRGLIHVAPGEDFEWIYPAQRNLDRPVTWSSILAYPDGAASKQHWSKKLAIHEEELRAGGRVHPQVTCRPITFRASMAEPSTFYSVPAFGDLMALSQEERRERYRDASWRHSVRTQIESGSYIDVDWQLMTVEEGAPQHLMGSSIAELAAERSAHPLDVVLDLALENDLETRFQTAFANVVENDVAQVISAPGTVLGLSDAGAHISQICDAIMPLDYLSRWVRDRDVAPIEIGVRRLTGELADLLGFSARGYLKPGFKADVNVIALDDLDPGPTHRVRDFPGDGERLTAEEPTGLQATFVNGTAIRLASRMLDLASGPGEILHPL